MEFLCAASVIIICVNKFIDFIFALALKKKKIQAKGLIIPGL
jgi:hypothetical protein